MKVYGIGEIYKLEHIDPELFFIELQCTVVSLEKYDHALAIFISEIKKYIEWFNIHREEVAKFTTDYAIRDSADKIVCREESIHSRYKSFEKTRLGYKPNEIARPSDMTQYYPQEEINQNGVVGIEIKLI